jgi:hypothetical protein
MPNAHSLKVFVLARYFFFIYKFAHFSSHSRKLVLFYSNNKKIKLIFYSTRGTLIELNKPKIYEHFHEHENTNTSKYSSII